MRRLAAPSLLVLLATLLFSATHASAATFKTGISDQLARTFYNPLYAPLKLTTARYIAPYDVMSDPAQRKRLDAWVTGARLQRQQLLVAFEHSRKPGKARFLPSVSQYTKAIKQFKAVYGKKVADISSWNEVNRCPIAGTEEGQPTCKSPKRVAQYYMAARKTFPGKRIVGLDVLDENNVNKTLKFIRAFKKWAKPAPKYYGLHNYSDTNRFSNKRTKAVLKATGKGELWLTETGGLVALGTSFPYNLNRAAKALKCMFSLAKSNARIKRLYIYQFNGTERGNRFDAGLVDPDGVTKRPGYNVVKGRKAAGCR